MITSKLHKWLFSITLLVSLVSFSGIVHEQVKSVNAIAELAVTETAAASAYYVNFCNQNLQVETYHYFSFNFKQFLQTQNSIFSQKKSVQKLVVFEQKNTFNTSPLKLVRATNTDDSTLLS